MNKHKTRLNNENMHEWESIWYDKTRKNDTYQLFKDAPSMSMIFQSLIPVYQIIHISCIAYKPIYSYSRTERFYRSRPRFCSWILHSMGHALGWTVQEGEVDELSGVTDQIVYSCVFGYYFWLVWFGCTSILLHSDSIELYYNYVFTGICYLIIFY